MLVQEIALEKCRWHDCITETNHVVQYERTFKSGEKERLEIPCCVKHQSDMNAALDRQVVEDDADEEVYQEILSNSREIYDDHATERVTAYSFHPSFGARKRMERAARVVKNTPQSVLLEALAIIRASREEPVSAA